MSTYRYQLNELTGINPPKMLGNGYLLQADAAQAYERMRKAAENDNIKLSVVSSFRSYEHQQKIWTVKYNTYVADGYTPENAIQKIIEYSTLPGTSRHHWGTDLDLIQGGLAYPDDDPLLPQLFEKDGLFYLLKKWMNENAAQFGFYEVYTNNPQRNGFKYEPWHFSFKPLSLGMLSDYLGQLANEPMHYADLSGGEHITPEFITYYIENYVLGINPELIGP